MNTKSGRASVQVCRKLALALSMVLAALSPSATAKDKPTQPAEQVAVVAHLPLPGAPVRQMFVQQEGTKQYLYVQQASKEGFTIIDVTKPARPGIIKREAFPTTASTGRLQMVGSGIALAEVPDKTASAGARHELAPAKAPGTASGSQPTESLRVLDLSDPANPKTLQTFDGVTSVLADDSRRLIYIANGDGLWILNHKHEKPPLPPCGSEDAFSAIADCQ
jgi:hypothetical protein